MTKSLTEKWREHNLELGRNYYLKLKDGTEEIQCFQGGFIISNSNKLKEVLGTVPTWDEDKETTEKLHLANRMWTKWYNAFCEKQKEINKLQEQLKEYESKFIDDSVTNPLDCMQIVMDRLQEQLREANEALKEVCMHCETEQFECRCGWVEPCKDCNAHYAARDYLEKWGVK